MGPFLQVGGHWQMKQDNGFWVTVDIRQDQDHLTASAVSSRNVHSTEATGFVNGPHFELTIKWVGGAIGKYTADLTHGPFTQPPIGFLQGETKDLLHPESHTTWHSEGRVFQFA